jgi:hypothetical protein
MCLARSIRNAGARNMSLKLRMFGLRTVQPVKQRATAMTSEIDRRFGGILLRLEAVA